MTRRTTHGESRVNGRRPVEYSTWFAMHERCRTEKNPSYARYGGRGIRVCERWKDYANFLEDMGRKPSSAHSIDRIDSNGDYEPSNCRWATHREQQNNKCSNLKITFDGKTMTAAEWARHMGLRPSAVVKRLRSGWSVEDTLTRGLRSHLKLVAADVPFVRHWIVMGYSQRAIAKAFGITQSTIGLIHRGRTWRAA